MGFSVSSGGLKFLVKTSFKLEADTAIVKVGRGAT